MIGNAVPVNLAKYVGSALMRYIISEESRETMRVIDLFAGCGGMSLGFENVGFDIVAAFDNWDAAITIYESNFSHPIYKKDLGVDDVIQQISDLHPDIIMGGPLAKTIL